jgi:hypothetical protein
VKIKPEIVKNTGAVIPLKYVQVLKAKLFGSRNSIANKVSIKCPCSIIKIAKALTASIKYRRLNCTIELVIKQI